MDLAMCNTFDITSQNENNSIPEFDFAIDFERACSMKNSPCDDEVSSLGESLDTEFSCSSFSIISSDEDLLTLDLFSDSESLSDTSETTQEEAAFTTLPDDVIFHVCSYLGVPSLVSLSECSRFLHNLTSKSEASWSEKCEKLWQDKVHVRKEALDTVRNSHVLNRKRKCDDIGSKEAYKLSVLDAKHRQEITLEELCKFTWSFRFKEAAGQDWTSWDPWWNNEEARQIVFLPDCRVLQVQKTTNDDCTQSHGYQSHQLYWKRGNNIISLQDMFIDDEMNAQRASNFQNSGVTWRFIAAPLDLPRRDIGGYIRLTVGGREVPTYIVRRSPTNNWGFILENCWGVYSSFDMPYKGESEQLEDKNMIISNGCQWREALLYNSGAGCLPEGDSALREFDAIWKESFGNQ